MVRKNKLPKQKKEPRIQWLVSQVLETFVLSAEQCEHWSDNTAINQCSGTTALEQFNLHVESCICIWFYMYTYIYTYTYIHIHTYIYILIIRLMWQEKFCDWHQLWHAITENGRQMPMINKPMADLGFDSVTFPCGTNFSFVPK